MSAAEYASWWLTEELRTTIKAMEVRLMASGTRVLGRVGDLPAGIIQVQIVPPGVDLASVRGNERPPTPGSKRTPSPSSGTIRSISVKEDGHIAPAPGRPMDFNHFNAALPIHTCMMQRYDFLMFVGTTRNR